MRRWRTTGKITEERVCHNHHPLAKWRVHLDFDPLWSADIASQMISAIQSHDRRAFLFNCYAAIFADLDAAVLFMMKYGK